MTTDQQPQSQGLRQFARRQVRHMPGWALAFAILIIVMPEILIGTLQFGVQAIGALPGAIADLFAPPTRIAPLFTEQVDYWDQELGKWADAHDLDPNLLATVMQIESCGHPTVNSPAGAQGLFQVMPYHFEAGEDMLDPDTNLLRGAGVLKDCLQRTDGDVGLALACYNGGPSVIDRPFAEWYPETQRYYRWGTAIYADAQNGVGRSAAVDEWIAAGGVNLCNWASDALGLN